MLEGEVLHVAVDARQLAVLEDRQSDVEDAVLVIRVLHYEEEAEVARLPGAHHSLVHLLHSVCPCTFKSGHTLLELPMCIM